MKKAIALVDCNSFYCSCERIFRPELLSKPVIVLSNNDGCAVARTQEAKDLGIKMGEPYFKIKNLCATHEVAVFSTNFALYNDISKRVMNLLLKQCPNVDVYSIDEAFVDFSGVSNLSVFGSRLRAKILKDIGIPTCVGIAPTKVLAKLANHLAKKSKKAQGVVNIMNEQLQIIALERVSIEDVWGIGRKSAEKLRELGIKTALDFREFKNEKLIGSVLSIVGLKIKHELMGITCFKFQEPLSNKKEIMCSRTFGSVVREKKALKEAISQYVSNAAQKMRSQKSSCYKISVFFRTNLFNNTEQKSIWVEHHFENPTHNTVKLIRTAEELVNKHFVYGYEYKKAGVKLSKFCKNGESQINFLSEEDSDRDIQLMSSLDRVNFVHGEGAIKSLSCGLDDRAWKMNQNFKSKRYTTSWSELLIFK